MLESTNAATALRTKAQIIVATNRISITSIIHTYTSIIAGSGQKENDSCANPHMDRRSEFHAFPR